jgi:hypothetical protein
VEIRRLPRERYVDLSVRSAATINGSAAWITVPLRERNVRAGERVLANLFDAKYFDADVYAVTADEYRLVADDQDLLEVRSRSAVCHRRGLPNNALHGGGPVGDVGRHVEIAARKNQSESQVSPASLSSGSASA